MPAKPTIIVDLLSSEHSFAGKPILIDELKGPSEEVGRQWRGRIRSFGLSELKKDYVHLEFPGAMKLKDGCDPENKGAWEASDFKSLHVKCSERVFLGDGCYRFYIREGGMSLMVRLVFVRNYE